MSVAYRLIAAHELDAALISVWRSIQRSNPGFSSPYFSPEFTRAVARVRNDVRVVVVENDGQVVALFPHQRSALGMGKPVGGPLSDFHGVIAAAGTDWRIEGLMSAADLAVWQFDHLVGDVARITPHISARETSPVIELGAGYERYVAERRDAGSGYIRKTEGLARKLVREHGDLTFTLHDADDQVMSQLIDWKRAQYLSTGTVDAFGVSWTRDLLSDIASTHTEDFAGQLSVLRAGGRMVAAHMGMRSRTVCHYWFPAYDPAFGRFSVGIILLLRMAETLAGMDIQRIDLGKGASQYKGRLMNGAIEVWEGAAERPSLLQHLRHLGRFSSNRAEQSKVAALLSIPIKLILRIQHERKFR